MRLDDPNDCYFGKSREFIFAGIIDPSLKVGNKAP